MTRQPWTIRDDATLVLARSIMHEHRIRHLPVLHGRTLVGILSERELALMIGDRVEDAMVVDVHSVSGDEALEVVAAQMAERRHGSVVIVDRRGVVEGIFTTVDALKALAELSRTQVTTATTV